MPSSGEKWICSSVFVKPQTSGWGAMIGDGELSDKERQAMRDHWRKLAEERRKKSDTDGDGQVSREEQRAYREKLEKQYDADKDGQLSAEERRKMIDEEYGGSFWDGGLRMPRGRGRARGGGGRAGGRRAGR